MKKIFLPIVILLVASNVFAQESEIARWSFGIKGGIDYYRVSPYASAPDDYWFPFWKDYASQASFAAPILFVERTVNPYFGYGLEVGYFAYNRTTKNNGKYAGVEGGTLDAAIYGSVNVLNLINSKRLENWQRFNIYANFGLGGGWYHYDIETKANGREKYNSGSPFGYLGLTAAYSISRPFELFLEGQYRSYTKDNMGGANVSSYSTDALALLVGLRYKIGTANKTHTRNVSVEEYYPAPVRFIGDGGANSARLQQVEDDVNILKKDVAQLKKQLDELKAKLKELESKSQGESVTVSFQNIEFGFDNAKLTESSKQLLDEIVKQLKADKNWNKLVVSGHTDNIGSADYNKVLSASRAVAVKDYLVKAGIDGNKITTAGWGFEKPIATNDTEEGRAKNRRVDFEIFRK
ncbi:MAG: OmpA family protein [Paludibacter sp.]|jgi:OOP family OmpA-OmpF porin|nr:OmpA family protein [Paludibacter sp.]